MEAGVEKEAKTRISRNMGLGLDLLLGGEEQQDERPQLPPTQCFPLSSFVCRCPVHPATQWEGCGGRGG